MEDNLYRILRCLGKYIYSKIEILPTDIMNNICELRLRSNMAPVVITPNSKILISNDSKIINIDKNSDKFINKLNDKSITSSVLYDSLIRMCEFSIYKRQNEINNGFITLSGGHRVGICGTCNLSDGKIRSVTDITSINIRVARQFIGCATDLITDIPINYGIMICGVPSSGKTTLLRDIARSLSLQSYNVSVLDERFELAAAGAGELAFDVGMCDVYSGYPKKISAYQAIRTMSPDFIVCDELTGDDTDTIVNCLNYGVNVIASVHCDCLENMLRNRGIVSLLRTNAFKKIVFLDSKSKCRVTEIIKTEELKLA